MYKPSSRIQIFLLVAAALSCLLWLSRGYFHSRGLAGTAPAELITIGTETWPGYLALYVAQEKGYYSDEGLNVRIKRYVALAELSKDYMAGKMQGRANLTIDAVNEQLQGMKHRAVLAIDYSNGSDAIVAREGIDQVKDFAGRRVGYEPNTLEEFFLSWALAQNGLSLRDVISVAGNPEQTVALLKSGEIDVAVTHEPFLSAALQPGKAHAVYSSAQAPGLITDILTFRSDFIKSHPAAVEGVIRAYFRALDFWKKHPWEAHAILAREFGATPESVQKQMKGITMLDLRDNRTSFSFASGFQSLYGNMRKIGDFLQAHQEKGKPKPFATDELVEAHFINELIKKQKSLTP